MPSKLSTKPWLDEPDFDRARAVLVNSTLAWLGVAGALAYAMYLVVGLATGSPRPIVLDDVALSVLFVGIATARSTGLLRPKMANAVLTMTLVAASIGFGFTSLLQPATFNAPGFLILVVATGLLLLSWPGVIVAMTAALAVWLIVGTRLGVPLVQPLIGTIIPGMVLGALMHAFRYRTYRNLHASHLAERERTVALSESEERWRGLVENMPETVAILDREGRMEFLHQPQMPPGPHARQGALSFDQVPAEDAPRLRALLQAIFEEGLTTTFEMAATIEEGKAEWYSVSAGPIRHGGKVVKAVLLGTNITERRRTVEALRNAERLSGLGTLVAGVAHEINNPLTYIRGNLELTIMDAQSLLPKARDRDERETLESIVAQQTTAVRGIDQVAHITASLKRVARRQKGARTMEDPNLIVDSVLVVAGPRLGASGVVDAQLHATRHISVDATEFSQVLLNLVFNAIDAVKGSHEPHIEVRTSDDSLGGIRIDVKDNGAGISEKIRATIFTPFQTTKAEGTGLGLSISQRIVNDHGGSLTFETSENGTTFSVRLPGAPETIPTPGVPVSGTLARTRPTRPSPL